MLVNIWCHTEYKEYILKSSTLNDLGLIFQTIKSCTRQNLWMDMLQLPKSQNLPLKVLSNAGILSFMCSNYVISAYEKGHRASCKQFLIQLQLTFQNSLFMSWHTVFEVTNIRITPSILHFYHSPNSFRIRVVLSVAWIVPKRKFHKQLKNKSICMTKHHEICIWEMLLSEPFSC